MARNPHQKKCPGCRGFVKIESEICARCGLKLEPGGDNGSYTDSPRKKEKAEKEDRKKDDDRQNAAAAEPDPAGAIDGRPAAGERRRFYGFAAARD
jgi:hypothetical protein